LAKVLAGLTSAAIVSASSEFEEGKQWLQPIKEGLTIDSPVKDLFPEIALTEEEEAGLKSLSDPDTPQGDKQQAFGGIMDKLKDRLKNNLSKGRMQEHHNYQIAKLTKAGKHIEAAA
jgi:hypothetical protein